MTINPKLLEPISVWSNGGTTYSSGTLNVSVVGYKYAIVKWRYYKEWGGVQIEKVGISPSASTLCLLSGTNDAVSGSETASRVIAFNTNGTITIEKSYVNDTTHPSNDFCVPMEILVTNIL